MCWRTGYRTVKGRMGFFGWVSRVVLVIFNALMIGWGVSVPGKVDEASSRVGLYAEDERAVATGFSIIMIIGIWAAGTVILGIWALLTRPPRTLVPIEED